MTKHLVFFVHGMGEHSSGWSDEAWDILKTSASLFSRLPHGDEFDKKFQKVELTYDNVFERYREHWQSDSNELIKLLQNGITPPAIINKVIQASTALGKNTFFTTHLLDVIMYRFLSLVNMPVRVQLAADISSALRAAGMDRGSDITWSVVSHSLGTCVIHDTLHYMFTGGHSEIEHLNAQHFAPHCGLFIANVSRVLQSTVNVYDSIVRPSLNKKLGIFQYFLTAEHILDPFTKPRAFEPPLEWLDAPTRAKTPSRFQQIKTREVLAKNIHGLEHYLHNPKVHVALFRALYGNAQIIPQYEEQSVLTSFQKQAEKIQLAAVKDELVKLKENIGVNISDLLTAAETYNAIVNF